MIKPHFELMANYNAAKNQKIGVSMAHTSEDALWEDHKAFFGSILGTLNHLMVGDLIWLSRFNCHPSYANGFTAFASLVDFPSPTALTQLLYLNKEDYIKNRLILDRIITQFINETVESDYSKALTYTNTQGKIFNKPFSMLIQHLFNHQTHHRGQVATLLTQINIDIGETDLLMLITDY